MGPSLTLFQLKLHEKEMKKRSIVSLNYSLIYFISVFSSYPFLLNAWFFASCLLLLSFPFSSSNNQFEFHFDHKNRMYSIKLIFFLLAVIGFVLPSFALIHHKQGRMERIRSGWEQSARILYWRKREQGTKLNNDKEQHFFSAEFEHVFSTTFSLSVNAGWCCCCCCCCCL